MSNNPPNDPVHDPPGTWIPLPRELCKCFQMGRPCPKIPCKYFHGNAERMMAVRKAGHNAYRPSDGATAYKEAEEFARVPNPSKNSTNLPAQERWDSSNHRDNNNHISQPIQHTFIGQQNPTGGRGTPHLGLTSPLGTTLPTPPMAAVNPASQSNFHFLLTNPFAPSPQQSVSNSAASWGASTHNNSQFHPQQDPNALVNQPPGHMSSTAATHIDTINNSVEFPLPSSQQPFLQSHQMPFNQPYLFQPQQIYPPQQQMAQPFHYLQQAMQMQSPPLYPPQQQPQPFPPQQQGSPMLYQQPQLYFPNQSNPYGGNHPN